MITGALTYKLPLQILLYGLLMILIITSNLQCTISIYPIQSIHYDTEVLNNIYFLLYSQIRVNAINPTITMTDLGKIAWGDPIKSEPMLARIPLKRFAGILNI